MAVLLPYEEQRHPRSCGAAALCMVYRSLGLECDQDDLHTAISRPGRGGRAAHTHLLACDALRRGLPALVIRARSPWPLLLHCAQVGIRVILNHRLEVGGLAGHYSVLVGVDEEQITLHDPLRGPERVVERGEFLRLWGPAWQPGEVAGYSLLALGECKDRPCPRCGATPDALRCPGCRESVALRPGGALGCASASCDGRLWERVHCPYCDRGLASLPK